MSDIHADVADDHPDKGSILVCVGPSVSSARLVYAAHRLAGRMGVSWLAVTVDAPDAYPMDVADRQRQLAHMRLAESLGAKTIRLSGERVSHEIIRCACKHGVSRILVGKPTLSRWRDRFRPSLVHDLVRYSGDMDVQFISGEDAPSSPIELLPDKHHTPWRGYAASLLSVVMTTTLVSWGRHHLTPPDLVMLYLLPIMAVAFRFGQGPALMASALSVAAYDFFFVHPYLTFLVEDSQYILTFTILFAVGIVISSLMTRIRQQEQEAQEREQQTDALHHLSREILTTIDDEEVARIITRHASNLFGGEAALCLKCGTADMMLTSTAPDSFQPSDHAMTAMRWSCDHGQASGRGTENWPESEMTCLPISTSRILGVLAFKVAAPRFLHGNRSFFLEAFAYLASLAIDRVRLGEEVRLAAIRAKAEELRGVLSMVSHDLRTPLAAITGAGTTLRDDDGTLNPLQQQEMLETICTEAVQMDRLITNLLDMARLESRGYQLSREWIPFEELAGSAMARLEDRLQGRKITVHVDARVPMLHVDPIFFTQILINLLDNAIKYTPEGTAISWTVDRVGDCVAIRLNDQGPGIPSGQEERIFEKFVRGESTGVPGSGLGLAICRGVVEMHGGTIQAMTSTAGGGEFVIHLPSLPLPPESFPPERDESDGDMLP